MTRGKREFGFKVTPVFNVLFFFEIELLGSSIQDSLMSQKVLIGGKSLQKEKMKRRGSTIHHSKSLFG